MPTLATTAIHLFAAALLLQSAVAAAAPSQLVVRSNSPCPAARDVARLLDTLLPDTTLVTEGGEIPEGAELARIDDLGASVRVYVKDRERLFDDPRRQCKERARRAAVFIGLVLAPSLLGEPERKEPAAPRPEADPDPVTRDAVAHDALAHDALAREPGPSSRPWSIELGPLGQIGTGSGSDRFVWAGGLGGRFVWHRAADVSLGAAALLPATLTFDSADARVTRLPLDVSLRLRTGTVERNVAAELGPLVALVIASGERVDNPERQLRAEWGLRGAVSAAWHASRRLGMFASLHAMFIPAPSALQVRPDQTLGTLPTWWLGGSIGVVLAGGE